jgi:hypothetical protein
MIPPIFTEGAIFREFPTFLSHFVPERTLLGLYPKKRRTLLFRPNLAAFTSDFTRFCGLYVGLYSILRTLLRLFRTGKVREIGPKKITDFTTDFTHE